MEAQREAIAEEARKRGWQELRWASDPGFSGKDLNRPGLQAALQDLSDGRADVLVVSKMDRLSRSVHDFSGLVERARREGWSLRILDLGLDMTTPEGELMANVLATFAQFERRRISARIREALSVKRAQGVRLGRPRTIREPLRHRIKDMRAAGASYASIADSLNSEGVPTARGRGVWYPSAVRAIAQS
jgi:DNA invertase Pin-like site-specific DNA recombinase